MVKSKKRKNQTFLADHELQRRQERKERFQADHDDSNNRPNKKKAANGSKQGTIVGTSKNLEKPYLRLTTFADPNDIRPEKVLKKSFKMVKQRYVNTEDFEYCSEQLKSIRQDLKVQGIENSFTVDVYETHARMLLEHGDLSEFKICHSAVFELPVSLLSATSLAEFRAYGILYGIVKESKLDLKLQLRHLPHHECVDHAVAVLQSVHSGNYVQFFRLYKDAPYMSAYLMDYLVNRVRKNAYRTILNGYRPSVEISFMKTLLDFDNPDETRQFLRKQRAVLNNNDNNMVDCKESLAKLR